MLLLLHATLTKINVLTVNMERNTIPIIIAQEGNQPHTEKTLLTVTNVRDGNSMRPIIREFSGRQ